MEYLRARPFIWFSASASKLHYPLFAIVPPVHSDGWELEMGYCTWAALEQNAFPKVSSIWMHEQGPWCSNVVHLQCTFPPPFWAASEAQGSWKAVSSCATISCINCLTSHTNAGFQGLVLNTSYKTNHQAATAWPTAKYRCTALTNEQKQLTPLSTEEGNFPLCLMPFPSPALSYKYSSAWAQMNNAHTTNY